MALNQYASNPAYPDRYSRSTRWSKVLPVSGRPLQTAELTELQSILQDNVKQGFDALFRNGSKLSGLTLTITQQTVEQLTISVTAGQFYAEGLVLDISAQSVTIPAEGTHTIGIALQESILTELTDTRIREAGQGYLLGRPGAHRQVVTSTLVADQAEAYPLGRVVNGVIFENAPALLNPFQDLLAQYVYDRSGNFKVRGFDVSSTTSQIASGSESQIFVALTRQLENSQDQLQQTLTSLEAVQAELRVLDSRSAEASQAYQQAPTDLNLARLNDLAAQREVSSNQLLRLSQQLTAQEARINQQQTRLNRVTRALVETVSLQISPGSAYLQGKRFNLTSPSTLTLTKTLETATVDSVKFVPNSAKSSAVRTFALNQPFEALIGTELTLMFYSLTAVSGFSQISVKVSIREDFPEERTLTGLLTFIVSELNKTGVPNASVLFTASSSASAQTLRSVLKQNVLVSRRLDNQLVFESKQRDGFELELSISPRTALAQVTTASGQIATVTVLDKGEGYLSLPSITLTTASGTNGSGAVLIPQLENGRIESIAIDDQGQNYVSPILTISAPDGLSPLSVDVFTRSLIAPDTTSLDSFQLGFRPVAEVLSISALVTEELIPITRGPTTNGRDFLREDSVFSISRVTQGGQDFIEGVDYRLVNQSEISWAPLGQEPQAGTTYYVSINYTRPLVEGVDFELDESDSIRFFIPVPTEFTVTYSYYLKQAGTISLNSSGEFTVQLSSPSSQPIAPPAPAASLEIATFLLTPEEITLYPTPYRQFTVQELNALAAEVSNTALTLEKLRSEVSVNTNADFFQVELLQSLENLDFYDEAFTAAISAPTQSITWGYRHVDQPLKNPGIDLEVDATQQPYQLLPPHVEVIEVDQSRSTRTLTLEPLSQTEGRMYSHPNRMVLNESTVKLSPCSPIEPGLESATKALIQRTVEALYLGPATEAAQSIIAAIPKVIPQFDSTNYLVEAHRQSRHQDALVHLFAEGLVPSQKGYQLFFKGVLSRRATEVQLKPGEFSIKPGSLVELNYSQLHSLNPSPDGTISLLYRLPLNLSPGAYRLDLVSEEMEVSTRVEIYSNLYNQISLSAVRQWTDASITTRTERSLALVEEVNREPNLIQQFQLDYPAWVTAVKLKVDTLATVNTTRLQVLIRDESGILTRSALNLDEIPLNGTQDWTREEWTVFSLEPPVFLRPFHTYELGLEVGQVTGISTAVLGEYDRFNQSLVEQQLYIRGALFQSVDGLTRIPLPEEDLTFQLIRAEFDSPETIYELGQYGVDSPLLRVSSFALNNRDTSPPETQIQYEYQLDGEGSWTAFEPNQLICLRRLVNSIYLRARLQGTFRAMPQFMISGSSISLYEESQDSLAVSLTQQTDPYAFAKLEIDFKGDLNQLTVQAQDYRAEYPVDEDDWVTLTLIRSQLIDPALGFYRLTFGFWPNISGESPYNPITETVRPLTEEEQSILDIEGNPRRNFQYRFNLRGPTGLELIRPAIRNIKFYVYSTPPAVL